LEVLSERPVSTAAIETRVDLSRTRLEMLLKVLDSDGAAKRVKGGWVATGEPWEYDAERHRRIGEARAAEQRAMLEYLDTTECRLVYLRRQLDDADAAPCGRCDTCTGTVWSPEVDAGAAAAAQERLLRPGVPIPPRKQWPSGMAELGVPVSGRIPAGELAEEGRVIGRLSDVGWGARLRELVTGDDVPVPPEVLEACVKVLAGWSWTERPVGVVGIGSRTRPHQLAHLARRIAEIGRLPLLGTAVPVGERPAPSANSAQRLAAVWDGFTVPELGGCGGPVLVVDDVLDSGWTATVVARLLRRAGAPAVLPFALALAA
jgi:ATP-dependent DNA helicase RecQ